MSAIYRLKCCLLKGLNLGSNVLFLYIFLTIFALNLVVFSAITTTRVDSTTSKNGFNSIHSLITKESTPGIVEDSVINPELEIFQYIVRHSILSHNLAFKLANTINEESKKYEVDPFLVLAVIKVESEFRVKAVSEKGAVGLMQVMPRTGKYIAKIYGIPYKGHNSLFDPKTNITLGIAYLSHLESRYGNVEYALWAYNHGPKRYKDVKRKFRRSKPYYVKKVMNFRKFLRSERVSISKS